MCVRVEGGRAELEGKVGVREEGEWNTGLDTGGRPVFLPASKPGYLEGGEVL